MPATDQEKVAEELEHDLPENVATVTDAEAESGAAVSWWRTWDAILVLGLASLSPLLYMHAQQLWTNVDLRFFPVLPVIALALAYFCGKRGICASRNRAIFATLFLIAACVAAAYGAWKLLPWFALLAACLLWFSWMLARLGKSPWYRIAGWLLPLALLLTFPTDANFDLTPTLEAEVLATASGSLDLVGVPHLPADQGISTKNAALPVSRVCRGISNPYLLLTLALLLVMFTQRSFLIALLTWLTVPLWSWLACSSHLAAGLYLLEEKELVVFTDQRNPLVQAGLVVLCLFFVWLSSIALRNLFAPFIGYSTTSNAVHKFYNWLMYWPEPDPLRKRRSESEQDPYYSPYAFWNKRVVRVCLYASLLVLVSAGGYAGYQIFS
ncbi:MAG: archaeosortase/exosortase family protein [bacterium]|nr:archaeosortase/exosortase family protein [bacterium]